MTEKRDDALEQAARRVKQWLDDGMPSWGAPEGDIKRLIAAALAKAGAQ